MNLPTNVSPQQLRRAADIQERILELQQELAEILEAGPESSGHTPGKRRLSAQGLANIRAGARRRWAKARAENGTAGAVSKPKRKMSAAGRAAIAARMRARWAAAKRAGRNAL
ncbi:MAG TPA: hypothetical protein VFE51_24035 [Verrucomicrobiae bacterium]|nr:hypothetical protein [Verrucomicrobiae bacterium]